MTQLFILSLFQLALFTKINGSHIIYLKDNPWPKDIFHDTAQQKYYELQLPIYSCLSDQQLVNTETDTFCSVNNLIYHCEGCEDSLSLFKPQEKLILITNSDKFRIYNLTLKIFWADGTEAALPQHTTVHIGNKRQLQGNQNLGQCTDAYFQTYNNVTFTYDQMVSPLMQCAINTTCSIYLDIGSVMCTGIDLTNGAYQVGNAYNTTVFPGDFIYMPSVYPEECLVTVDITTAPGIFPFVFVLYSPVYLTNYTFNTTIEIIGANCCNSNLVGYTQPNATTSVMAAAIFLYFTPFQPSISTCNLITYSLTSTPIFLPLDTQYQMITVQTSNVLNVGTHQYNITGYLTNCPAVMFSVPFWLTIQPCQVTNFTVNVSMITSATYILGTIPLLVNFATYIQSPLCGFTPTYSFLVDGSSTLPSWFIPDIVFIRFNVSTTTTSFVGSHTVQVNTTIVNTNSLTVYDVQNLTLIIQNSCNYSSWTAGSVSNMTATVLGVPISQTFAAFTLDVSGCDPIDYTLSQSYPWLSINSTTRTITVSPTLSSQIGTYTINAIGNLTNYPIHSTLNVTFFVTINACVIQSITNLLSMSPNNYIYTISSAAVTWNYPTFTQTPNCGTALTFQSWVDGSSTFPTWFTQFLGSNFTIQTSENLFVGIHNVTIVTTGPSFSDTQTVILNFTAPTCSITSLVPMITSQSYAISSGNVTINYPTFTTNCTNPFTFNMIIDGITTNTTAWLTNNQPSNFVVNWSSNFTLIGIHNVTLVTTSNDLLSFVDTSTVILNFTCQTTSITVLNATFTSFDYQIAPAGGGGSVSIVWPTFTSTPDCGIPVTQTIYVDGLSTFPVWFSQTPGQYFTTLTTDCSLIGVHNVTFNSTSAALTSFQNVQTCIINFKCSITSLVPMITSQSYAIGTGIVQVIYPTFTTNCIPLNYSVLVDGIATPFPVWFTQATGSYFNISTSDFAFIGSHNVTITTTSNYNTSFSNIQTVIINFMCSTTSITSLTTISPTTFIYTLGGVGVTWNYPTFTQTPNCGNALTYSFMIDGVSTIPIWLIDVYSSNFTISTNDTSLVGNHTIQLTSTYPTLLSDVQSVIVTFILPCNLTTWNSATISNIITSVNAIPSSQTTIAAFTTLATACGAVDYILTPSTYIFISFDPILLNLTVATSLQADVGTYNLNLTGSLSSYPMVAPLIVPFTVTINSCALTSIVVATSMITTASFTLGTPLTILFPTFTQTPSCNNTITYTFLIDGVATVPIWLTADVINQQFLLASSDVSLAGLHNIQITSSYPTLLSDIQTVSVTFIIPCNLTTWNTALISPITTSVSVIPSYTQLITSFTPVATGCGSITYVLSPSTFNFISFDPITMLMTVATSLTTDIGTYSTFNLVGSLTSYPLATPLTVPFSVVIGPCIVTGTSCTNCANNATSTPITIFQSAVLITLAQYIQTPLCNYPVSDTLDVDTIPTSGSYSVQSIWAFQNTTIGSIYSNDFALSGMSYNLRQYTNIDSFALTVTKTYTFTDPCTTTSFIPQTLRDIDAYIHGQPQQETLQSLADTVSNLYGVGSCYLQTITQIVSGGLPVPFATLSGFIWTIESIDPALVGSYIIDVSYQLTRYPSVTTILSFNLRMFILNIPQSLANQTYQAKSPQLQFSVNQFTCIPFVSDKILIHNVTNYDGTTLPSFITYVLTQTTIDFSVMTQLNSNAGIYKINITANHSSLSGLGTFMTATTMFTLTVTEAPSVAFFNFPPVFDTKPLLSFDINIGDAWNYTLPVAVDPEGENVSITAQLGIASLFMTFSDGALNIAAGATLESLVQPYYLTVTLQDESGATSTTQITIYLREVTKQNSFSTNTTFIYGNSTESGGKVSISAAQFILTENLGNLSKQLSKEQVEVYAILASLKPNSEFNWAEAFASALKKKTKSVASPTAKIISISRSGDILIVFDQMMVVPPLKILQNETVMIDNQILPAFQVLIKPGYYSDIKNLTFTYNFTGFSFRLITLSLNFDNPNIVSSFDETDKIQIIFNGNYFFFSEYGKVIAPRTILEMAIPRQFAKGGFAQALADISQQMGTTTNAIMAGNMVLNIMLSASLQQLWSMINTQQIIVLMPLFNINLPPNAAIFFGFIMQIASFDILPTDKFYNQYFNMGVTNALNDNFAAVGLKSNYLLYNLGSMIIGILTMPVIIFVILLLKICRQNNDRIHKWHNKLSRYMFFTHPITIFLESYTMLAVCSLINVTHVSSLFIKSLVKF